MNTNFILKVSDAKLADIRDALLAAGVQVRSIIEIYREDEASPREEQET